MTDRIKSVRRVIQYAALLGVFALGSSLARATDDTLLIQMENDGKFRVWHVDGETRLSEHELAQLEANAAPNGGESITTEYGPAKPFETPNGIIVELPEAKSDRKLLLDHASCSEVRSWHADGVTLLTEEQLVDLYGTASPDGGPTVTIGNFQAKAYTTKLGVTATLWKKVVRRPAPRSE